ncbi:hypothetical protein BCU26_011535 [Vibrio splendidus]|uniref:hypothetical protein n=2 Tax=Vibrio splendidus TaxID=29497 RepID=UPI000C84C8E3|nr:hypothetical protein [Vibrio splendidus]MDH5979516.1 hypothetical protein [Vibrio splendidus]PMH69781.1 hypothetical protein BCU61_01500 [Vibrio splendidus]PMJ30480.1 hypothetical protein BCU26_12940 [Vibrio splendidus]
MFEPIESEIDELQLAISLPELDSVVNGTLLPFEALTASSLSDSIFDALFVSGTFAEQSKELSQVCVDKRIELVVLENPTNDLTVIHDVVINLVDKLFSDEMPNNIDLADLRLLNQYSDHLLAFNHKCAAINYMSTQKLGVVMGGVYLAHGQTDLDEYENTNQDLIHHIPETGFLCSSYHSLGRSECTILIGIKRLGETQ